MDIYYVALIDGEPGAYGVTFPDLPGCVSMGKNPDEAKQLASDALREWVEVTEAHGRMAPAASSIATVMRDPEHGEAIRSGSALALIPLVRESSRAVKANMSIDSSVLAAIDATAERLRVTRSAVVEMLAKRGLHELA